MFLPENKPREIEPLSKIKMFLYGEPYTGKTTFASKFPNPIILSTDGNYQLLDTPAMHLLTVADWYKAIEELGKGNHTFETVIVDLADGLFDIIRGEVLENYKLEHESDSPHGKGWNLVRKPSELMFHRIASLPYNIIFIGHSKIMSGKDRVKGEYSYTAPKMSDGMANYLKGLVTYTLYTAVENIKEKDELGDTIIYAKRLLKLNPVDETIKNGGRVLFKEDTIELDYDKFVEVLTDSVINPIDKLVVKNPKKNLTPLKPLKPITKPTKETTVEETPKTDDLEDFK